MYGQRVTINLCSWAISRQYCLLLGGPGFYVLLMENSGLGSAQVDWRRQSWGQEKVLKDQFFSVVV